MGSDSTVQLTFEEIQTELQRIRGSMPRSTLYYQMERLGIHPNLEGYYDLNDLEVLKQLNRFLLRHRSIKKFRNLLIKEYQNAD